MRSDWDTYFMKVAVHVAERATCKRAKVGAVIVDQDKNIVSTGYNGSPPGHEHCIDQGCEMVDDHCIRTIHAELNALLRAGRHLAKDGTLYVTHYPCRRCQDHAILVGIKRIIYLNGYGKESPRLPIRHVSEED